MKQNIERISAGLATLLDEVETMLNDATEGVSEKAEHADAKVRQTLHRVGGHLRNARSEIVDRAHKIDGAIHSNPWRAIALTAAVSFFAGLLVRRR